MFVEERKQQQKSRAGKARLLASHGNLPKQDEG
jgi:hypothetical protein